MRVTVCELPHEPVALRAAWAALCEHTNRHAADLVLLPEFALLEPVWESDVFDQGRWEDVEMQSACRLHRLRELGARLVVGTRPVTSAGWRFHEGYLWSEADGFTPLRRKYYLPDEPGSWEALWFDPGDPAFPPFRADGLLFGLNICTELWALDTYSAYAAQGVDLILSPRATSASTTAKWLSVGTVAAVRSGAFSLSSNRVDATGAGGGVGWIISPEGEVLARTSPDRPFATMDLDLAAAFAARGRYPRYVLSSARPS